jgi:hypothetical protein
LLTIKAIEDYKQELILLLARIDDYIFNDDVKVLWKNFCYQILILQNDKQATVNNLANLLNNKTILGLSYSKKVIVEKNHVLQLKEMITFMKENGLIYPWSNIALPQGLQNKNSPEKQLEDLYCEFKQLK